MVSTEGPQSNRISKAGFDGIESSEGLARVNPRPSSGSLSVSVSIPLGAHEGREHDGVRYEMTVAEWCIRQRTPGGYPRRHRGGELGIGAVPHGFRSSFRDWAAERTDVPREVCEIALAHVNSDRVEAAYRRSDLFEKRRSLMADWAHYITRADR